MKKSLNRRLTVYFLIIMALTVVVSVVWNYHSTRQSIVEMEMMQVEGCTKAVSSLLDHYWDAFEDDSEPHEYTFLGRALRNFCRALGQEAIYVYTVDPQTGRHQMLIAAGSGDEPIVPPQEGTDQFPFPETQLAAAEDAITAGKSKIQRVVWNSRDGIMVLWLAPYKTEVIQDQVFVGMQYNFVLENNLILKDFLADILLPIAALGAAFLVLALMIRKRVTLPILRISDRMQRFARNSRELPEPLNIDCDDEIGEIASSFETMTEQITTNIASIEQLTRERLETSVQMDVARRIQYGMVPEKSTFNDDTYRISAMTRPAKAVGGDFYDCFRRDDGLVCIVMGDVSGKGITGALFMSMTMTVIHEKLNLGMSPAQALNQTNEQILAHNPEGIFATVFVAILDPRTGELCYANAGHTYPVVLGPDASDAVFLKPDPGIALGLFEDADIVDETMRLAPGQGMVLYTDGVTDAINAEHVTFGADRLLAMLQEVSYGTDPAEEVLREIRRSVDDYRAGVEPFDDMAVLVLFWTGAPAVDDLRQIPISLSSFATIKEMVFVQADDTPATRKALLACDEALANIVHYSGATWLAFGCDLQDDMLHVTFADNGIAYDPTAAQVEERDFEELDSGGMGIALICQIASSVNYERKNETNLLTLSIKLR